MNISALRRPVRAGMASLAVTALAVGAAACTSDDTPQATSAGITLTNCGKEVTYPGIAKRLLINDGNIASLALAVGAQDSIAAVSAVHNNVPILSAAYGDAIAKKPEVAKEYPSMEEVVAAEPDVMMAGWGYGFGDDKGITPDSLAEHSIGAYVLTESCRSDEAADKPSRGMVDPWEALRTDLNNVGVLTGHEDGAKEAISQLEQRLAALEAAPKAERKPVGFVFDSARSAPYTSGAFGAPQGVLDKAGAANAAGEIKDTWTTIPWESVAETHPDFIALVDYPGQSFEEKIQVLRTNPATKDLEAVKKGRFVNLPYAMWTESSLNIDAAEYVRQALEKWDLVPHSQISTSLTLPADLAGREYFS